MQTRHDYGARLEPAAGLLHGAGQDPQAVADYRAVVGHEPLLWMTYTGVRGHGPGWGRRLAEELAAQPTWMIPQVGLSMTRDSRPEEHYEAAVAAGDFDPEIAAFVANLAELGRPVYVRIGFEFNGPWNGYQPETYIAAYRRVAAAIRAAKLPVALVWCAGLTLDANPIPWSYWPGDDVVDWCGLDLFFPEDLHDRRSRDFLEACHRHGKPVMIGECTPRSVGVLKTDEAWARWFAPLLRLFDEHPGVKAICYINWEWQIQSVRCSIDWLNWGDCRLERNPELAARWRSALTDPVFQHGGSAEAVQTALRIPV